MNYAFCFLAAAGTLLLSSSAFAQWQPPADPDPSTILQEAQADTRAGRYDDALAKHVWYHENAEQYDPGQTGVRRSFALRYWQELADRHPPAAKKLEEYRAKARKGVLDDKQVFDNFADFAAISRVLKKEEDVVQLHDARQGAAEGRRAALQRRRRCAD